MATRSSAHGPAWQDVVPARTAQRRAPAPARSDHVRTKILTDLFGLLILLSLLAAFLLLNS